MLSFIAFVLFAAALANVCQPSLKNVQFDITALQNDEQDYVTQLLAPDDNYNRSIVYNFCRNTVSIPRDLAGGDKCEETQHEVKNGQVITTTDPSPVFFRSKYGDGADTCTRLGLDFTNEDNSAVGLYDTTDPAMGIVLKYKNGDFCCPYASCSNSQYRQQTFTISLRCADAVDTIPTTTSIETNNNNCDYTVYYRSIHACPTKCPRVDNNVCGLHGVCGYDPAGGDVRCYCSSSYTGTDCETFQVKSLFSVNYIIMAVTVLLTVVVILTIFYVWNKLRKISVNPDAFESLENKFNELGQMTY